MPRKSIAAFRAAGLAVLLTIAALPGCGDSPSNDFKAYNELEQPIPQAAETTADDQEELAAAADGADDATPAESAGEVSPKTATESPSSGNGQPTAAEATAATSPMPASNSPQETLADIHGNVPAIAEKPLPEEQAPAAPRKVELLVKDHEFPVEDGYLRVSYDDLDLLRVLNMEPVTPNAPDLMPKWLRELDGKRIRIRGFMYPPFEETGIARFVLARDNQICCFGRDPKVYDLIDVQMRPGETTHYIQNRPFDVTGVFHIEPVADLELLRLYSIDDAQVIEP